MPRVAPPFDHAVVIGVSIARLLAARTLSAHSSRRTTSSTGSPRPTDVASLEAPSAREGASGESGSSRARTLDRALDAMGRGSRSPAWFEGLGVARPTESTVKMDFSYTTRLYHRRPRQLSGADAVLSTPDMPRQRRVGVLSPVEGIAGS